MLLTLLKPQVVVWLRVGGYWKACRPWLRVNGEWKPCGTNFLASSIWRR